MGYRLPRGSEVILPDETVMDWGEYMANAFDIDDVGRHNIKGIFGGSLTLRRHCNYSTNFSFGVDTRKNIQDFSGTGALLSIDNNMLKIESGTDIAGYYKARTKARLRYRAGRDAEAMFTALWSGKNATATSYVGVFDDNDGFMVGYTGDDFSVVLRKDGVDEVITQDNFNLDTLDGNGYSEFTLNSNNLNVWRINYGYLGVAPIVFEIFIEGLGFLPFHVINKMNKISETTITVPYLPLNFEIKNNGTGENIYIKIGSLYMGTINGIEELGFDSSARYFTELLLDKPVDALENELIVFHNKDNFFGRPNKIDAKLLNLNLSTDGTKSVALRLYITEDLPISGTFTDKDSDNSTIEFSTDAQFDLTVLESELVRILGKVDSREYDIKDEKFLLQPGEYAIFTTTSKNISEVSFSNRWAELF